jgi:hypothetical protein
MLALSVANGAGRPGIAHVIEPAGNAIERYGAEASAELRRMSSDGLRKWRLTRIAMAEHPVGRVNEFRQALNEAIARGAQTSAYWIGEAYAWRGEKEKASEWLERACRQRDAVITSLKINPLLASLRNDPRHSVANYANSGKGDFPIRASDLKFKGGFTVTCSALLMAGLVWNPAFKPVAAATSLSGTFSVTGSLNTARYQHKAVRLTTGEVLVMGRIGVNGNYDSFASAELYNPSKGKWTVTGNMTVGRTGPAEDRTGAGDGRLGV